MIPVIYVAIFLCVACAALATVRREPAVRLPLPMIMDTRHQVWRRVLVFLGNAIPRRGRQGEEVRGRLIHTGSRVTVEEFGGIKLLSALAGALATVIVFREFGPLNPAFVVLGGGVGFVAPDLWLRSRVVRRQKAIVRVMPEVIDLLSLCIGAGLDFLVALNKVLTLNKFKREPLIEELSVALQEIKLGKRRAEALKALAKRVNLPELTSFLRTVVQADRMGTPIAEVLATHSEDLRLQRFMRAERTALQAPIKILVPLIFCIMPCVALIVGAPILLQFVRHNPFGR